MDEKYNPGEYWEARLSKKLDLTTVGDIGLGQYNLWLYKARYRALRQALKRGRVETQGKAVAEVGVGSGAFIPFWEKCGASTLVGVDITHASVEALSWQYPNHRFFQADVTGSLPTGQDGQYDIVTAFDVLFHIVDDAAFQRAIANLGKLAKAGGWVIISDGFGSRPYGPFHHEYHRSHEHYARELEAAGLRPVFTDPIFYLMNTPICAEETRGGRFLFKVVEFLLWVVAKFASRPALAWVNHIIGFTMYILDGIFHAFFRKGPGVKNFFAQKKSVA